MQKAGSDITAAELHTRHTDMESLPSKCDDPSTYLINSMINAAPHEREH